jgi:LacI family transcriptional regulator
MLTLVDVARHAGVSVSTASRVLSGQGYASVQSRQRVLAAAESLGYEPNQVARSLRLSRTRIIGLLVADIENFFYSQLAKGVTSVAREHGYHVVLANSEESRSVEAHQIQMLSSLRVDGLVFTPTGGNRCELEERFIGVGVPVVQVDRYVKGLAADVVLTDNVGGAREAVEVLIAAGHTKIAILAGSQQVTTGQARFEGYRQALAAHGIPFDDSLVRTGSFTRDSAMQDAQSILNMRPRPTALFAANNILAEGAARALVESQLVVPRDLSVVAFDDAPWMSALPQPLTTVDQPTREAGRIAATILLERLSGKGDRAPQSVTLRPRLIVRNSVAPLSAH